MRGTILPPRNRVDGTVDDLVFTFDAARKSLTITGVVFTVGDEITVSYVPT